MTIRTMIYAKTREEAVDQFWERMAVYEHGPHDLKITQVLHKRNMMAGAGEVWDIYYRKRDSNDDKEM